MKSSRSGRNWLSAVTVAMSIVFVSAQASEIKVPIQPDGTFNRFHPEGITDLVGNLVVQAAEGRRDKLLVQLKGYEMGYRAAVKRSDGTWIPFVNYEPLPDGTRVYQLGLSEYTNRYLYDKALTFVLLDPNGHIVTPPRLIVRGKGQATIELSWYIGPTQPREWVIEARDRVHEGNWTTVVRLSDTSSGFFLVDTTEAAQRYFRLRKLL